MAKRFEKGTFWIDRLNNVYQINECDKNNIQAFHQHRSLIVPRSRWWTLGLKEIDRDRLNHLFPHRFVFNFPDDHRFMYISNITHKWFWVPLVTTDGTGTISVYIEVRVKEENDALMVRLQIM